MWIFFHFARRVSYCDMGTVAEKCPSCRKVRVCAVTGMVEEFKVYFILSLPSSTTPHICRCETCGSEFPARPGRYRGFVSAPEASAIPIQTLVEQTNPSGREQLQLDKCRSQFANDTDFVLVADAADQLGEGQLRAWYSQGLLNWEHLDAKHRGDLRLAALDLPRVFQFGQMMTDQIPGMSGCFVGVLACLLVWASFIGLNAVNPMFKSAVVGFAGLIAGPLLAFGVVSLHQRRRFRQWLVDMVIPEGEKLGVDFAQFAGILLEQPADGATNDNGLRALKDKAATVVSALVGAGKVVRNEGGIDMRKHRES
jgi:hypothetical protein